MVAATIAKTVELKALPMQTPGLRRNSCRRQITSLRGFGTYPGPIRREFGRIRPDKEQGRRRSITPTALPAPDIEIGLRHPVNYTMPRESTGKCDPFHNRPKKLAASLWQGINGIMIFVLPSPLWRAIG